MTISISILENQGILEVKYSDDPVTSKDLDEQRSQVADAISRSNTMKVLVDASALERVPSPLIVFEHNKAVASDALLRRTKFAVVCHELGEEERCLEDTGVNRGVHMQCFTSKEEALSWLGG